MISHHTEVSFPQVPDRQKVILLKMIKHRFYHIITLGLENCEQRMRALYVSTTKIPCNVYSISLHDIAFGSLELTFRSEKRAGRSCMINAVKNSFLIIIVRGVLILPNSFSRHRMLHFCFFKSIRVMKNRIGNCIFYTDRRYADFYKQFSSAELKITGSFFFTSTVVISELMTGSENLAAK